MKLVQVRSSTRTCPRAAASRSSIAAMLWSSAGVDSIARSPHCLKVKVIFINDGAMDNAPDAGSRGLSSPGAHRSGDPRHRWYRVVARRLAKAIRGRSQEDVLAAAALAASVVEQECDGTSAARRGVNLLDLAQIAPGPGLAPDVRALLEQAAENMLHATSGT